MKHPYEDIINLPCPTSKKHPRMSMHDRAAQFSPFAALTGYGDAITETARVTDQRHELTEEAKIVLDRKQQYLCEIMQERPMITVTYFQADPKKAGGKYLTVSGYFKRIDEWERLLILIDGTKISLDDIVDLDSEYFP